jgi:hypothetical protein
MVTDAIMGHMTANVESLGLYLHLARAAERRSRPLVRDRLLLLGGVLASQLNLAPVAAYCRWRVLQHNPGHMVARWTTLEDALRQPDFLVWLKQLQRRYGTEQAEQWADSLGIERRGERAAYFSDGEYAAALLGQGWDQLQERFGPAAAGPQA